MSSLSTIYNEVIVACGSRQCGFLRRKRTAGSILVTDLGRLMIRNIAMRFDAYLAKEKEQRYSKTI
ncbi:MAG: hypothetical protein HYY24_06030 [Verrucomicrobia bacterium]|nr:hypothetical protein [Verrucomicrobiota bacterium]